MWRCPWTENCEKAVMQSFAGAAIEPRCCAFTRTAHVCITTPVCMAQGGWHTHHAISLPLQPAFADVQCHRRVRPAQGARGWQSCPCPPVLLPCMTQSHPMHHGYMHGNHWLSTWKGDSRCVLGRQTRQNRPAPLECPMSGSLGSPRSSVERGGGAQMVTITRNPVVVLMGVQ